MLKKACNAMAAGMNSAGSGFIVRQGWSCVLPWMGMHLQTSPAALRPPSGAERRRFRQSLFDQRLGISFTVWDSTAFLPQRAGERQKQCTYTKYLSGSRHQTLAWVVTLAENRVVKTRRFCYRFQLLTFEAGSNPACICDQLEFGRHAHYLEASSCVACTFAS